MQLTGLTPTMNTDRVERAEGHVYEHSIDIGNVVISFRNIGTITIQDGKNSSGPVILALALALLGVTMLGANRGLGLLMILGALALGVWALSRSPDIFLSIGTCDGRRTNIVSKDKAGLKELQDFLRRKLDEGSAATARLDISADKVVVQGGIAFGTNSQATGAGGTINNRSL